MIHYLSPRKISGFWSESGVLQWRALITVTALGNWKHVPCYYPASNM